MPAGFCLQDWLHLKGNHYDRVIHFSFGFLLLYPMRELLLRSAHAHKRWATWLSVVVLAALSSFFEIIEAIVALIVRPDLGAAYLGTQGDIWDAQKRYGRGVCWRTHRRALRKAVNTKIAGSAEALIVALS